MRRIVLLISVVLFAVACDGDNDLTCDGEITIAHLHSMAKEHSVKIKNDYTIRGHVVANDKLGEVNYAFVVADGTGGVEIAVDSRNIDVMIPLFSEVTLRCTGLTLGRIGDKIVLGNESSDYVVGRLAESELFNYAEVNISIDSRPKVVRRRIAELDPRDMLTYITIDSLRVAEEDVCWADRDTLTNDRVTTIRHFTDTCDTLRVVVDGRCKYASLDIPTGYVALRGILDWSDGAPAFRITNGAITPL